MSVVDFLLARISEDEDDAGLLHDYTSCDLARHGLNDARFGWECTCGWPQRVRAECEAKRGVVALHFVGDPHVWELEDWACRTCQWDVDCEAPVGTWPCDTLRHLAAIYADHPDYRDEWKPVESAPDA